MEDPPSSWRSPCYIAKLPIELLSKIFLLPNAECHDERGVIKYASQRHPMRISHVCQHWRAVALHTPALWAILYVNPVKVHPDRLNAFLERSAYSPLTISIYHRGLRDLGLTPLGELYISLLSKLEPHAPRWLTLDIATQNERIRDVVMRYLQHIAAPALRRFRFWNNILDLGDPRGPPYSEPDPPLLPFHGALSQLRNLHLDGVDTQWLHCRLQNLTSLTLTGYPEITLPQLLFLLSSNPRLAALTIHAYKLSPSAPTAEHVTLPQLEYLLLHISDQDLRIIWDHLYLPRLSSLSIHPGGPDHSASLQLLTHPNPHAPAHTLTFLALWPRAESLGFTRALYAELPLLRTLLLCPNDRRAAATCVRDLANPILRASAATSAPPSLVLPRLTTLLLMLRHSSDIESHTAEVDWALLQHVAAARAAAGVPLRRVFLEYEHAWASGPPGSPNTDSDIGVDSGAEANLYMDKVAEEEAEARMDSGTACAWLLAHLDAFGMMPRLWSPYLLRREYAEDCFALEAAPAAEEVRVCGRLGFTLFEKPAIGRRMRAEA